MPRKPPPLEALTVAYLTTLGKTQVEIGETLSLKQSAVSRLFQQVKDEYIQTSFREELVDAATMREVKRRAAPQALTNALRTFAAQHGSKAPVVHVVPVPKDADRAQAFKVFGAQAAPLIRQLLTDVRRLVGVAWGSTLWHVMQELRDLPPKGPWRVKDQIEFIPLCGDPLLDSPERYKDRTSSRLVTDLSDTVNGEDAPAPRWLGLVPAFVPQLLLVPRKKAAKQQKHKHEAIPAASVINSYINLVPAYRAIFGPRLDPDQEPPAEQATPIAEDLDMILTAAGPAERAWGFGESPLLGLGEDERRQLAENIYGDIGGALLPKPSKGNQAHPLVQELTNGWTGLKREHLQKCAERAFREMESHERGRIVRPGVTLLSFGPEHLEVVREAIREGLVNQLIVGSDLEAVLLKALKPR